MAFKPKHQKSRTVTAVMALCALTLAACGGGDGTKQDSTGASAPEAASAVKLTLGTIHGPNTPSVRCGFIPLQDDDRLTKAGIEIETIHSGQLGTEDQILQQASTGEVDITFGVTSLLATVFGIEEFEMFEAYYLYDNFADVDEAAQTEVAQALFARLDSEANLTYIGDTAFPYGGPRSIFGSKAIRTPADLKGFKLRVPQTNISTKSAQALGASPTPIAYGELYLALQQGIVDGAEAPLSVIAAESFDEPAKVISLTEHLITALHPVINSDSWDKLSGEQQATMGEVFADYAEKSRQCASEDDTKALEAWRAAGKPEIVEDVDRDAMRDAVNKSYSKDFPWSEQYVQLLDQLRG